jgi:beta-galactosidase/beta-glucuronidase
VIEIGERSIIGRTNAVISVDMPDFIPWSPENPHLYEFAAVMGKDRVESYFGMRKFDIQKDEKGIKRLFLNNKPNINQYII